MEHQKKIFYMKKALKLAKKAFNDFEVPVGALVLKNSKIIGRGYNQNIKDNDVSSHAEILAIRQASKFLKNFRLNDCILFTTLEPCHMCASAIVQARLKKVYIAALEPKMGSIISTDNFFDNNFLNHKVDYEHGICSDESSKILKDFFIELRKNYSKSHQTGA